MPLRSDGLHEERTSPFRRRRLHLLQPCVAFHPVLHDTEQQPIQRVVPSTGGCFIQARVVGKLPRISKHIVNRATRSMCIRAAELLVRNEDSISISEQFLKRKKSKGRPMVRCPSVPLRLFMYFSSINRTYVLTSTLSSQHMLLIDT